jgi:hypothetical protein
MRLRQICAVAWVIPLVVAGPLRADTADPEREYLLPSARHATVSAVDGASNTDRAVLLLAANSAVDSVSNATGRTVRNATIAGVRLGMSMDEAVNALEAAGFELHKYSERCLGHDNDQDNPCYRRTTGVTLERISGPSQFEGGFSEMTVRLKDDQVYWIRRVDNFLLDRLPDDFDRKGLVEKYRTSYFERFSDAKYRAQGTSGRSHLHDFDDLVPPPWEGAITSPHAQVSLAEASRGRHSIFIEMHWKDLVGVEW